jgi:hypothetical protein
MPPPKKYEVTHWSTGLLVRHLGVTDANGGQGVRHYGVQPMAATVVPVLHRAAPEAKVVDAVGL